MMLMSSAPNLIGPDLIVIALIIAVLAIPFAMAIAIVFMMGSTQKEAAPASRSD
jgi:hypothetical protein